VAQPQRLAAPQRRRCSGLTLNPSDAEQRLLCGAATKVSRATKETLLGLTLNPSDAEQRLLCGAATKVSRATKETLGLTRVNPSTRRSGCRPKEPTQGVRVEGALQLLINRYG